MTIRRGQHPPEGIPPGARQEQRIQRRRKPGGVALKERPGQHMAEHAPLKGNRNRGCGPGGRAHRSIPECTRGLATSSTAARSRASSGCNGGVGYSNCLNAPPGRQSPATQSLLFLDALEESPSDHLDPPADGSSIRREDSRDLPGHTAAVWRHGTLSRPCRDLLTCGFSLG